MTIRAINASPDLRAFSWHSDQNIAVEAWSSRDLNASESDMSKMKWQIPSKNQPEKVHLQ
jgi:hypothetical protein